MGREAQARVNNALHNPPVIASAISSIPAPSAVDAHAATPAAASAAPIAPGNTTDLGETKHKPQITEKMLPQVMSFLSHEFDSLEADADKTIDTKVTAEKAVLKEDSDKINQVISGLSSRIKASVAKKLRRDTDTEIALGEERHVWRQFEKTLGETPPDEHELDAMTKSLEAKQKGLYRAKMNFLNTALTHHKERAVDKLEGEKK